MQENVRVQHDNTQDNSEQVEIRDNGSLHHYRTEIPNIIFDLNLEPYEFKLYCVLKKIAGDRGSCFMSSANLAGEVGCQKPKLIECKKSLQTRGLIKITKRQRVTNGDMPDLIEIVDVWAYNMQRMTEKYKKISANDKGGSNPGLPGGGNPGLQGGVIDDYGGGNPGLPKEEHLNKNQKQQQQDGAVFFDCLKDLDIPIADKIEISETYPLADVENAIACALHPLTKIKTTLQQYIKWACKNKPELPKSQEDKAAENKKLAAHLQTVVKKSPFAIFEVLNQSAEIGYTTGQCCPTVIAYTENGFNEQLLNALRKYGFGVDNLRTDY